MCKMLWCSLLCGSEKLCKFFSEYLPLFHFRIFTPNFTKMISLPSVQSVEIEFVRWLSENCSGNSIIHVWRWWSLIASPFGSFASPFGSFVSVKDSQLNQTKSNCIFIISFGPSPLLPLFHILLRFLIESLGKNGRKLLTPQQWLISTRKMQIDPQIISHPIILYGIWWR